METEPLYEERRYYPLEIEAKLRSEWYPAGFDLSNDLDETAIRFAIFQDFFTRCHRMYRRIHTGLSLAVLSPLSPDFAPYSAQYGLVVDDVLSLELAPQPVVGSIDLSSDRSIDELRLTLLRNKPVTETLDAANLEFAGPARFLQRLWRLARTETHELPRLRFGVALQLDTEITELVERMSNECYEAFSRRSAAHYLASLSTANNELHRYVFSDIGAHDETIKQAVDTLVLQLTPACPFIAAELWAQRSCFESG